ncbi:MAG: substrate-binding domain-containing protein [Actinomycetota bacterium]|nr:substrate-binding domain-containing protein [Actinomycetota bacterium]
MQRLAEVYGRSHPGVRFELLSGTNSGAAVRGVVEGTLDLAVMNRDLKAEEQAEPVRYTSFARDAVTFATPESGPVRGLSSDEVRDVYAGKVRSWEKLGGERQGVVVLDRDPDESARKLVLLPFMADRPVAAQTTVLAKAGEMADALQGTPGALGYTSVGYLQATGQLGVRLLALDGIEATAANVASGRYPWHLTFGLVTRADAPDALRSFVDFARGEEGQRILSGYGYAPAA